MHIGMSNYLQRTDLMMGMKICGNSPLQRAIAMSINWLWIFALTFARPHRRLRFPKPSSREAGALLALS